MNKLRALWARLTRKTPRPDPLLGVVLPPENRLDQIQDTPRGYEIDGKS